MKRWVYAFQDYTDRDSEKTKSLLGGKGSGLVEMCRLALPVPPGFILTTALCNFFYGHGKTYPESLESDVKDALAVMESEMGLSLGHATAPLLLSVRSGAKASMPGMMDTILNLGLNDETVEGLKLKTGDGRFAYDSYRRFIQMYSNVVLGLGLHPFEEILDQYKMVRQVQEDSELPEEDLKAIVERFKAKIHQISGVSFPQDVHAQLWGAIGAVLKSWMNPRAIAYRSLYDIPEDWGTAVIVQSMVFGNLGDDSGTGVAFTRNPSTGEKVFFGEYLLKAQGEDVVAGIRTPEPLTNQQKQNEHQLSLEEVMPEIYQQLCDMKERLEIYFHDMQDIEFTIQQKKLWLLQTRNGKRTAAASLRIAVDMVEEKLISRKQALLRFDPPTLDQLLHPCLSPNNLLPKMGMGLPASPGAAIGRVFFTAEDCVAHAAQGEKVILVREETSPEDIQGMAVAQGILTARGGMTSHAAVVARGMGKPCVVGTENLYVDLDAESLSLGGLQIKAGEIITLNGSTGEIFKGKGRVEPPVLSDNFQDFMKWADETRRLEVRANAETVQDARVALEAGAQGIGLCRTEHMFFEVSRILAVRQMILAKTPQERRKALLQIFPMQRQDFVDIFKVMRGLPVTVRLLDPPLHEFLPQGEAEIDQLAHSLEIPVSAVRHRISELRENNPMLGHRGCRLGVTAPEIYEIQVDALLEAAAIAHSEGFGTQLEIMVPLVSLSGELRLMRNLIDHRATRIQELYKTPVTYLVGTMIELPRAALKAGKIALMADFMSFGTNDLTQTTFGFSRDDASSFLGTYRQKGIVERDPFMSLDQSGVGELIQMAIQRA
ncbi:MAG: pyruvate, phosphate dikinase, partial [Holosporales bacterium]|nr:pyruvate, phosphate dikinase [Holosporales bacterium]